MNARTCSRRSVVAGSGASVVMDATLTRRRIVRMDGPSVQNAIYISGGPEWPITSEDWEARAAETLQAGPFGYIAGGAGSEATMRANLEAFERRRLRPRMLVGNAERDLSVEVLGLRSPVPYLLAPIWVLSIAHPDAELAVAR